MVQLGHQDPLVLMAHQEREGLLDYQDQRESLALEVLRALKEREGMLDLLAMQGNQAQLVYKVLLDHLVREGKEGRVDLEVL